MKFSFRSVFILVSTGLVATIGLIVNRTALAVGEKPPGPDRFATLVQNYTQYTWWLARWSDSKVMCQVEIDHDNLPTSAEILHACGGDIYGQWLSTIPCDESTAAPELCSGYYLHFVEKKPVSRTIATELPPPVVWVTVDRCVPFASTHRCSDWPVLVLIGEEPLSEYSIVRLEGTIDGVGFTCNPTCQLDLGLTDDDGIQIHFWAYSDYGDSSDVYTMRVRVQRTSDTQDPYLYIDVLSSQWRGSRQAPFALEWNTFPTLGGLPDWLSTPESPTELESNIPYEYLAGKLIKHGVVNADDCLNNGLLENGYANACGMDVARDAVTEWQNQFDLYIFLTALDVGVPAQLLKNIFSRESQFWPSVNNLNLEAGLGQLTDNGADTALLWNQSFFEQFCPTIFDTSVCQKGYSHLSDEKRSTLRVSLVQGVDAFCPECPLGLDIDKARASISIFAETLLANCAQAGMVLDLNYTLTDSGLSYEDLWRFTLVNYNAGPGCLGLAVHQTNYNGEPLDWEHVSSNLTPACQGAFDYVMDISQSLP